MILEFIINSMINYKIVKIMTIWYGINNHDLRMDNIFILPTYNIDSTTTQHRYLTKER